MVVKYIASHFEKGVEHPKFEVYVVWQCHILGNKKWLVSSTLHDGMYYEVTYNEAKHEFYLDAYKFLENVCIKE